MSQPHTLSLRKMINYAISPYSKNKIYNMGMPRYAGQDGISRALREKELMNVPLWEIMWIGKRALPTMRQQITMYLTGPGLIDSYLRASCLDHRFMETKTLNAPGRFGQRGEGPLAGWTQGMNSEGRWIMPGKRINSTV